MNFIIVAIMISLPNDFTGSDVFAFTQFPFPSRLSCETFLKQNQQMVEIISSSEYDGRDVALTLCLDNAQLVNLMKGTAT